LTRTVDPTQSDFDRKAEIGSSEKMVGAKFQNSVQLGKEGEMPWRRNGGDFLPFFLYVVCSGINFFSFL
jgi:hypothetical protein